jgi:predicted NBD/HSP70 family sugar kinase
MARKIRNAADIGAGNRLAIIRLLRQEPLTRAELARRTGLTRAAVTIISERLISEDLLREKKDRRLFLQSDQFQFAGIDISRHGIQLGLADLSGQTLACQDLALTGFDSFEQLAASLADRTGQLLNPKVRGIGISVPGPVDARSGLVINPPRFGLLQEKNIQAALAGRLGLPLRVENNAAARTLWEKHLGQGRALDNFLLLIVDSGIGGGLVLDGRLYRGLGFAAEIGHMSLDPAGPLCECGNRGCLENAASTTAVLKGSSFCSWPGLARAAEGGDPEALGLLRGQAEKLGQAITNVTNLLDLEAVIITGDPVSRPQLLLQLVKEQVDARRITRQIHALAVVAADFRPDAALAAAAMIAVDSFLA